MRKVLIFGGTQFVGKRLVSNLLEKGYDITVASRGNWPVPHKSVIKNVIVDRYDPKTYGSLKNTDWDVIVDQLSFYGYDAKLIVDNFQGKVGNYIVTTSASVYGPSQDCKESHFDSKSINLEAIDFTKYREPKPDTSEYKLGKREVEATYSLGEVPVTFVRFPMILGLDDVSFRFYNFYKKILNNEEIKISRANKRQSLINSREAARFLSFCVSNDLSGPFNACMDGYYSLEYFERKLDREINVEISEEEDPFCKGNEVLLNNDKAKGLGFKFEDTEEYLDELTAFYDFYSKKF